MYVRLDVMSGNKDNSQVKSGRYYADSATAAMANGTIVSIGELETGEREIHKLAAAAATDTYVGIVTTPEIDPSGVNRGINEIKNFTNPAGAVVRVHVLHAGDIFSRGGDSNTSDLTLGKLLVGKYLGAEVVGGETLRVYEVQSVAPAAAASNG